MQRLGPAIKDFCKGHRALLALCLVNFTAITALSWFLLRYPTYLEEILQSPAKVGLFISLPLFINLIIDLPLGFLFDRLGYKKSIMLGLLLYAVSILIIGFSINVLVIIIASATFAFASGMREGGTTSYLLKIAPKQNQSGYFGIKAFFEDLAYTVGPLLAGCFLLYRNYVFFGVTAIIFLLAFALSLFKLPWTNKKSSSSLAKIHSHAHRYHSARLRHRFNHHKSWKLIRKEGLVLRRLGARGVACLLYFFLYSFWDNMIWMIVPLYFAAQGSIVGVIMAATAIPTLFLIIPSGIWADHFDRRKLILAGLTIFGLATAIQGIFLHHYVIFILFALLVTAGIDLADPAFDGIIAEQTKNKNTGEIAGIWTLASDFGYFASPIATGLLLEITGFHQIISGFGIVILLTVPVFWLLLTASTKRKKSLLL